MLDPMIAKSPGAPSFDERTTTPSPHRKRVCGIGEMADLVRSHAWEETSLGPIETWPDALLYSVNLLLSCQFPTVIFWGPQMLQFYNDPYRPLMAEKHPHALGQSARECWKEAWHIIGPQFESVLAHGETVYKKEVLVPVLRKGRLQNVYWTYSYSPIYSSEGEVDGILIVCHDVTDEVLAARNLRESEARATRILESIGDAVIVTDAETRVLRMNSVAESLTGWSFDEARNQPLADVFQIVNETTGEIVESPADKVKRFGGITGLENHTVLIRKDGTETPIDDSGAPIRDDDGRLTGIVLVFRSVAERRRAENSLRQSEERVRLALAAADGVGTWDWDVANDLVYADEGFARLYGVTPAQATIGISLGEFTRNVHSDDWDRVEQAIINALQTGEEFVSEYRLLQRDGSVRWVLAVGRCSFAPDGTPKRFPGVTVDITERKSTEEALRESEARFNSIYSTSHEYIGLLTPEGVIIDCNRASLEFAGNTREEVIGKKFWEGPWFTHTPGACEMVRQTISRAAAGEFIRQEVALIRPSGETIAFDFSLAPVRDSTGKVIFLVPEGRDLTELKEFDKALRSSEERLRIATETAQLGTWQLNVATGEMECSAICKANFGRSPSDEFHYEDLLAAIHPEDLSRMQAAMREAIKEKSVYRTECRTFWPDDSLHWILISGRALQRDGDKSVQIVGVILDVTERHMAEAALLQNEKLAAVGRLASSIAHEINNPLESVTNLIYLARQYAKDPEVQRYLDIADQELRRVSVIANQTLRFHKQASNPQAVDAFDLFSTVLSIYEAKLRNAGVTVLTRKRTEKPIVCFEGDIRQVLNNLVGNAIDAMPVGGGLYVRSREGTEWSTNRKGLVLTVADTGCGMSPQVLNRVFEPFFTTKGIGGTGLGLWVSKEVVERHNGTLRIHSSPKNDRCGTVCTLFLPFDATIA